MKRILCVFLCMAAAILSAEVKLNSIKIPAGKNLLPNVTFQPQDEQNGVIANWGKQFNNMKFTWNMVEGRKVLRITSDKPGYHLGIAYRTALKPNTEYQYFVVARGKVSKGSKIYVLYREGKIKGNKRASFAGSKGFIPSEDWTLYSVNFKTPAIFENNNCVFYPALFWGSFDMQIAQAGVIEKGGVKPLAKLDPKFKNLLNNPEFALGKDGYPYNWNQDFEAQKNYMRFDSESDGHYSVTLLPRKNGEVTLRQGEFLLKAGKKYRIGAKIRTKGFQAKRVGLIVYNHAWLDAVGLQSMPENTFGWKDFEAEITLPKSHLDQYVFALYTAGGSVGEISIRDPFLRPANDEAAAFTVRPIDIAHLYRITPVDPLLAAINMDDAVMTFSFDYILPKNQKFVCAVSTKMGNAKNYGKERVFPVKGTMIRTTLGKLPQGKGMLKVVIRGAYNGKILSSAEYPIRAIRYPKLSIQPKRLNNLTQRLLSVKTADKTYTFSNPRNGWVYIRLSHGKKETTARIDRTAAPVIVYRAGEPFETTRYLSAGDHQLTVKGSNGGELIVNSIPEIMIYSWPFNPGWDREKVENYNVELLNKYILPNITTISTGYSLRSVKSADLQNTLDRGKHWLYQRLHKRMQAMEDPAAMAQRFRRDGADKEPRVSGTTFDEIYITSITDKWYYMQALWNLLEESKPMYTWSSGTIFTVNGLNADYFAASANNGQGQGKFLYECYARTQPTEKEAAAYLEKHITDALRRSDKFMPNSARYAFMVNGGYTNAGSYMTDTFAGPDFKKYWDMYIYKLANEPEFKNLAGVGFYAYHNGHEESLRWQMRLFRHYILEGNTNSLAEKYGYVYLPGFVKDGDFMQGLKTWTVKAAPGGKVEARTVNGFGRGVQKRMGLTANTGDTVCVFKRSAKAPNQISCTLKGLKPGKWYALRYVVTDAAVAKSKRADKKKLVLRAVISDSENVTAKSPAGKYVGADGIGVNRLVNNVVQVFQPKKAEVTLTFTDWQTDKSAGAPVGQELYLNLVRVNPYYAE